MSLFILKTGSNYFEGGPDVPGNNSSRRDTWVLPPFLLPFPTWNINPGGSSINLTRICTQALLFKAASWTSFGNYVRNPPPWWIFSTGMFFSLPLKSLCANWKLIETRSLFLTFEKISYHSTAGCLLHGLVVTSSLVAVGSWATYFQTTFLLHFKSYLRMGCLIPPFFNANLSVNSAASVTFFEPHQNFNFRW